MKVYAFDFDGTLTKRDSFIEFLLFVKGWKDFVLCFLRYSPLLVLMKLHLYSNGKTKERIFSHCFKDMPFDTFKTYCHRFAMENSSFLRPSGVLKVYEAKQEGSEVLIVSASVDNWVQPFFPGVKVLGTQVEVINGVLTGRFLTPNCYGMEKVRRIQALYPNRKDYELVAFGDSYGDACLLDYADEAYYKPFRK